MNEQLIDYMVQSEKDRFQIKELNKTTNSFIESVKSMIEENKE